MESTLVHSRYVLLLTCPYTHMVAKVNYSEHINLPNICFCKYDIPDELNDKSSTHQLFDIDGQPVV
jgi:hypothetical protein